MARKENPELTQKILSVLKNHPEGTYVSEIARELNIQKSTVSYILNTRLNEKIIEIKSGPGKLFRIIKLK